MIKTIDECFSLIQNGANIKQGDVDGGFPITRIETITNDKFSRDRMGYAGITDISKYTSYLLEDGDLLMSHINSVQYLGRTVLYVKQSDETIIHGKNLLRLKARRDVINPAYAKYCFYGHPFRSQIRKITKKSVNQASFAVKDLKQIKLNIPALSEQNEIVMILDKIQQVLAHRIDELSKLDDLIKARFVEMFGDPVSNPYGYDKVALSDLADIKIGPFGSLLHKEDYIVGGHPLLNPSHIVDGRISPNNKLTISDEKYKELSAYQLKTGDVVMGRRGEMGRCAVVSEEGFLCGTGSILIRTKGEVTADYIQKTISFPSFKKTIEDMAVGQTMPNLNVPIVSSFEIIKPPIEVQDRYYALVEQVDKSKVKVQKALDETQKLFDSLMQQYFG